MTTTTIIIIIIIIFNLIIIRLLNTPVALKYRVGVRRGIAVFHDQLGFLALNSNPPRNGVTIKTLAVVSLQ